MNTLLSWGTDDQCLKLSFLASYRAASIGDAGQVEIYLKNGADTSIKETNFGKDVFKIAEELAQESVINVLRSIKWNIT